MDEARVNLRSSFTYVILPRRFSERGESRPVACIHETSILTYSTTLESINAWTRNAWTRINPIYSHNLLLQLRARRRRGDSDRIPLGVDVKHKQIQARAPIISRIDIFPHRVRRDLIHENSYVKLVI